MITIYIAYVVLGWPRPNATNDEANKWGDLVYGVPEA